MTQIGQVSGAVLKKAELGGVLQIYSFRDFLETSLSFKSIEFPASWKA